MTEVEDKTEFKFSELSDRAKDKARDAHRYNDVSDDWWDTTYEDAVRMGALIGINITSTHHVSNRPGHNGYDTIDISFSGFCSQGDGASFEGNYRYEPKAIEQIKAECNDATLLRIAEQLTLLQVTRRLCNQAYLSTTISENSYSNSIKVEVNSDDDDDEHNQIDEDVEDDVTGLMSDFADWIYEQLEAEYDYLCSDEYVDKRLNEDDTLFDEDGEEII